MSNLPFLIVDVKSLYLPSSKIHSRVKERDFNSALNIYALHRNYMKIKSELQNLAN